MLHGVASTATELLTFADGLAQSGGVRVFTPDIRRHGQSGGPRSDVNYVGQYERDLADVFYELREEEPDSKIVVAGHSMGGGIALRYALLTEPTTPDGYLLLAPNFGEGPTQAQPEERDDPNAEFVRFDLQRMIGQIMFDAVGVKALDARRILWFNTEPVQAYSFRAVMSAQSIRPDLADAALQPSRSER